MNVKAKIPWQGKMTAKLVLSRVPVGYGFWRRLALFEHGPMDQPSYAYGVFKRHFDRVTFPQRSGGFVALELGPGDSLFSAMLAYAFGASASYLVDVGPFAREDLKPYHNMANFLAQKGLPVPDIATMNSLEELLGACAARYEVSGLSSLRTIPG